MATVAVAPPVVADTPALRGYPGGPGLDDLAAEPDAQADREPRGLSSPSVWQSAQKVWRDSGVEWQRPVADDEPAEAEWERVQAAPPSKRRVTGRAGSPGGLSARSAGALSATLARQSAAGLGQVAGPSGRQGRGGGRRVPRALWLALVAIVVVAALVAGGLVLFGPGSSRSSAGPQYPPATIAAASFAASPGQAGRGIFQTVAGLAASGGTVVAVGAVTGQWLPRAEFLVSSDGGRNWRLATVSARGGAQPPPALLPQLVAHGTHGWLATGSGVSWTSPDGQAWTLAPGIGPMQAGDQVSALAGTSKGFIAAGDNVPHGNRGLRNPVLWTSPDGRTWQRLGGSRLGLAASGRILRLSHIAVLGSDVIISGSVLAPHGRGRHSVINTVWQSGDGGASWTPAHLPVGKGVSDTIDGVAAAGAGFVAIRPGSSKRSGPDAVVYTSRDGLNWSHGSTITAARTAGLRITLVSGSGQGVIAAGQISGGAQVAYESADGRTWRSVPGVGRGETLTGVTTTSGGTVVMGGATAPGPVGQAAYLALAGAGQAARAVSLAGIAGATGPALAVNAIAQAGGRQVAVGAADGLPAIWSAATGHRWSPARSAGLGRPGLSTLTGLTHGRAGWLAVGGTVAGAAVRPIVLGSADGTSWQGADAESAFSGSGITLHAAAAGPDGYVAVGQQAVPATSTSKTTGSGRHKKTVRQAVPAHTIPAAWYSPGVTGWTRATGLTATGPGPSQMTAVAVCKSRFVAVGSAGPDPAAWTSANGRQWEQVRLGSPTGASTAALQAVAVRGALIVATGTEVTASGPKPFAEYSTDGGTLWQTEPLTAAAGPFTVTALTAAANGFVATGTAGQPGNGKVVVWWSATGASWQPVMPHGTGLSSPGAQAITALTAEGKALTGVGYLATPAAEQPTLWHATAGP